MGASVESRVPFLDYRIVQWSIGLSGSKKIKGFETKRIIKKLANRYLPDEIVRRKKSGFGVPLARWLRNERRLGRYLDLLRTKDFHERGLWKAEHVDRLIRQHKAGTNDHSELLWELINVELWSLMYLDQKGLKPTM